MLQDAVSENGMSCVPSLGCSSPAALQVQRMVPSRRLTKVEQWHLGKEVQVQQNLGGDRLIVIDKIDVDIFMQKK